MLKADFEIEESLLVVPVQKSTAIRNGTEELTYAAKRRFRSAAKTE
jgi:hypothetical protein